MNTLCIRGLSVGSGRPKVIVPVCGEDEKEILSFCETAAEKGEIIEWRGDHYKRISNIPSLPGLLNDIRDKIGEIPLLFTLRTKKEGGLFEGTADEYREIVLAASEHRETDIIDMELSFGREGLTPLINAAHGKGRTVILSSHDFEKTPSKDSLLKTFTAMDKAGADILKVACMPENKKDVLRLMEAAMEMKELNTEKPLIAISMGETGLITRLSGEIFGSVCTFGTAGKASAPGQIDADELKVVLDTIHNNIGGSNE